MITDFQVATIWVNYQMSAALLHGKARFEIRADFTMAIIAGSPLA